MYSYLTHSQLGSHPHVVQFFGLFTSPKNESFIVMEYMSRGSLLTALREEREKLTEENLLDM